MSAFVALNIEPDEESEEEIDDTKEIQTEEALKLYLNALKLHSQGAEYYPQAKEAYDSLFESEIFKYPESLSEYKRLQAHDSEHDTFDALGGPAAVRPLDSRDTISHALPETIYLSYKNHGQFILDSLKHVTSTPDAQKLSDASRSSLRAFAEALERDDSDLELWRKCARVGGALQSSRLARYCLESVLDGNSDGPENQLDQLGLEQAFAVEDLRRIVNRLSDNLSISDIPLKRPRKAILQLLKSGVDPLSFLPTLHQGDEGRSESQNLLGPAPSRQIITPESLNWPDLGKAILGALNDEIEGRIRSRSVIEISLGIEGGDNAGHSALPILQPKLPSAPEYDEPDEPRPSETVDDGTDANETMDTGPEPIISDVVDAAKDGQDQLMPEAAENAELLPDEPQPTTSGDGAPENLQPAVEEVEVKEEPTQTRKRSSTSVANDEAGDGGRTKSRRIRARESNAEAVAQPEEIAFDQTKYFEDRLETFTHADQWMFGTVGSLLSKLGVEELGTIDEQKQILSPLEQRRMSTDNLSTLTGDSMVFEDLRNAIEGWNDTRAEMALRSNMFQTPQDSSGAMKSSALAIFLEHSRQISQPTRENTAFAEDRGIRPFSEDINHGMHPPQEVAVQWLERHLVAQRRNPDSTSPDRYTVTSSYAAQTWPESMKDTVNQVIMKIDEILYQRILDITTRLEEEVNLSGRQGLLNPGNLVPVEFSQSLYELHLNLYASMTVPDFKGDRGSVALQRDRLSRWRALTQSLINYHLDSSDRHDDLATIGLRHLWATTLYLNMAQDADQQHVLSCFEDMKRILVGSGYPVITFLNNGTMPEISVAAVDKEVSRLKSKEFFMSIFGSEAEDPVRLIESIEPILDPSAIEDGHPSVSSSDGDVSSAESRISRSQELAAFLDRGDPTLKLFLWRRLQEAYSSIQYPTKSISCRLRSIETLIRELGYSAYADASGDERQAILLKWLKAIDKLLSTAVEEILDVTPEVAFECFDMDHLRSSMSALAKLSKLLHSFAMFEDSVRVGQTQHPEIRPVSNAKSLEQFKDRLRTMQVNAWVAQYTLLQEGMNQNKELFETPFDDRIYYLRSVHNALGIRSYCKYSNKLFPRLMKNELLNLPTEDAYESDVAQVLYDLYGLKFSPSLETLDHGCAVERLDRSTAIMTIDFVMLQADQINIKDLCRSELKNTIDTVQKSIGWPAKSVPALAVNKRILSTYLKSLMNPMLLFRAVRGIGELSLLPVHSDFANLAEKGWYFLLGSAALAKFRSQKRLGPMPTDDLDLAAWFFKADVELGSAKWKTWFRLAQVYDLKLEEDIAWSADKLNNHRADLVTLQRKSIHSYAMAVAEAIASPDSTTEAKKMMSELYTEFGFRIYASSRGPLSMEAFGIGDTTRHFSSGDNQQMYTGKPFTEMNLYSTMNYASYLFRRAMVDRPKDWVNHYMFSKCLWKMFNCNDRSKSSTRPIEVDDILDSLVDAVEALPQRKEPILEPHFKYVSVTHKLVTRNLLPPKEASERLLDTPWAKNLTPVDNLEQWKPFVLSVLKNLRNADKSNWHHRIVARAAHVIYDDSRDPASASAAKNELSQHIFTKAMTLQVWRPENERIGRHFVYTTRYAHFCTELLDQLNDRVNMELLLRRVRKKPHEYMNHGKLWEDMSSIYIKLFRRVFVIPEGHEEAIFKPVTHDEFSSYATRLEAACQEPGADSETVDALRDAVDLKKLNAGLTKPAIFEDLVADTYAVLYEKNAPKLAEQANNEENRERMRVDRVLMTGDDTEGSRTPTAPTPSAPGPKPRTKGVTRKELQRKADSIATKAIVSRQNLALKQTRPAEEAPRPQAAEAPSDGPAPNKDEAKDEAPVIQTSLPVSLQESADDESELSELDEDKAEDALKAIPPMFPNLLVQRVLSPKPGSEPSTNVSIDGGDGDSAPSASFQDAKSEQTDQADQADQADPTRPSDTEMDVDS